jgi:hypothetical protein
METDKEQLRLLAIFYYVVAGLAALFSLFPVFYLVLGILFITGGFPVEPAHPGQPDPRFLGWFFVIFASLAILVGLTMATLLAVAGWNLSRHRRYTLCFVVACIACAFMPFGTILGVFTIIVLVRDSAKRLFGRGEPSPAVLEEAL